MSQKPSLLLTLLLPVTLAQSSHAQDDLSFKPALLANADENLYYTPLNCCGLVAVSLALHLSDHPCELNSLAAQLPVTSFGTSMQDMASCLRSKGASSTGVEIGADHLMQYMQSNSGSFAIALIEPQHWVLAVPSANGQELEFFNYPRWHEIDPGTFKKLYMGKALLIEVGSQFNWQVLIGSCAIGLVGITLVVIIWRPNFKDSRVG